MVITLARLESMTLKTASTPVKPPHYPKNKYTEVKKAKSTDIVNPNLFSLVSTPNTAVLESNYSTSFPFM